jgi:aarF domain-containing kinase
MFFYIFQRILVTEWIDGVKVTDIEGIKAQGLDLADVDKKLLTLMGEQIFHTGFVHADPHPGNGIIFLILK